MTLVTVRGMPPTNGQSWSSGPQQLGLMCGAWKVLRETSLGRLGLAILQRLVLSGRHHATMVTLAMLTPGDADGTRSRSK